MAAVRTWVKERRFTLALVLRGGGQGVALPYSSSRHPSLPPVDHEVNLFLFIVVFLLFMYFCDFDNAILDLGSFFLSRDTAIGYTLLQMS